MEAQVKNCQNCKKDFTIESEDFNFYQKIKVPPPTFCPDCRFIRRTVWRNERSLYKRSCSLCKKNTMSMYPEDSTFPVYCRECWYGDGWDGTTYGRDYDFSKSFFEQWKELSKVAPRLAVLQRNIVNSDYSNMIGECKNVYLSMSVVLGSENVFYSSGVDKSFNIFDSSTIKESDSCYEDIEGEKNYNTQYVFYSRNCIDSYYLIDCVNCSNCFMSYNLRNKQFFIRNKQYSKDEYFKEIEKINLKSRNSREAIMDEFTLLKDKPIYKYSNLVKTVDSTGNNLLNVKNTKNSFLVYDSENMKFAYRVFLEKDCMDVTYSGRGELIYEYTTGALNNYNVKFSFSAHDTVRDAEFVEYCVSSSNLFGCISIKSKNYVILNKEYTKEEYEKLIPMIKEQMNSMPYIDKKGRVYKYGEFFPVELSVFSYNETMAQDFFPLTKEEALNLGYAWKDHENKNYVISTPAENIPDNINDVNENILNEVLGCIHKEKCDHRCQKAFRLTKDEFNFYKKHDIPLPNKCSNCRFYERFSKILPPTLYHRKCMKEGCQNEFETPYATDRSETIYCERCYQQEVY
jgi:hypothetical protein